MKSPILFLLAFAGLTATVTAEEELRWAADPDSNAPYAFYDAQDHLIGFEYDLVQALGREMGRKPVFTQNNWDGLIPGLNRGLYDIVVCGIEITPAKEKEVLFSNPYYTTFEQFVNRKGGPDITSLDQLSGKSIGTLSQTHALAMLEETPGVIVKTYDEEINAYADVANGRLDGVLLDFPIAKYYASPNPHLQLVGPPFGRLQYGIALRKNEPELQTELNAALEKVITSGELREILSKWGLWTPTMAHELGQPEAPSLPETEFTTFVESHAQNAGLLTRLGRLLDYWPLLLAGAWMTLKVSLVGMVLAVGVGFSLATLRVFGPAPLQILATLYIEIVRGTPLLIQLLLIFYGLPNLGIKLDPFLAGVLGLGLNYAAYEAENYRAGLLAIPKGQMEAARALGMTHLQGLRFVVMPQSFRLVLPPVTNDFISLLKDSSLVSMVTLIDLTGAYNRIATQTFDYFGAGILVAAIYLLIGLPFVRLARYTEQKLAVDQRRPTQRPGLLH